MRNRTGAAEWFSPRREYLLLLLTANFRSHFLLKRERESYEKKNFFHAVAVVVVPKYEAL